MASRLINTSAFMFKISHVIVSDTVVEQIESSREILKGERRRRRKKEGRKKKRTEKNER